MRIHYLQHVSFEGLSSMEKALLEKGHSLTSTQLYENEVLPSIDDFDWLIVMGGPMGIYDEADFPWLSVEKQFIHSAITANKIVLGICLGAQLIADALGAKVTSNPCKEIGWFNINLAPKIESSFISSVMPKQQLVYHWHGDTFAIPEGATLIASSAACTNQGFIYNDRVIALQFHMEMTAESAAQLVQECGDKLEPSETVQTGKQMLSKPERFKMNNKLMANLLEAIDLEFSRA